MSFVVVIVDLLLLLFICLFIYFMFFSVVRSNILPGNYTKYYK